jgi:hypothetical protein
MRASCRLTVQGQPGTALLRQTGVQGGRLGIQGTARNGTPSGNDRRICSFERFTPPWAAFEAGTPVRHASMAAATIRTTLATPDSAEQPFSEVARAEGLRDS